MLALIVLALAVLPLPHPARCRHSLVGSKTSPRWPFADGRQRMATVSADGRRRRPDRGEGGREGEADPRAVGEHGRLDLLQHLARRSGPRRRAPAPRDAGGAPAECREAWLDWIQPSLSRPLSFNGGRSANGCEDKDRPPIPDIQ